MACPYRGLGPEVETRFQDVPFHSQVSPYTVGVPNPGGLWNPPNMTTRLRAESKAIACQRRDFGPLLERRVHEAPFHSHVSPKSELPAAPPNNTTRPRAES